MRSRTDVLVTALLAILSFTSALAADEVPAALPTLKVPDGFTIELAAGPPLVERPIVAAFDDEGRLYVAESSGSNDPVQKQLAEKPHHIVRLEDTNHDGKFDRRTVFADHMMFPEGAMFFHGSLYVSAAPSIWKLTDKDGDGVADERIQWYQGKTLTGCANDLHGPYAGPDGWIYWCKGAFAEQTHMVHGHEWKTTAAHIFRCRPDGSGFEPVMTGGMDNPVDVAFMPDGERILSGTFFAVNPRHDGLIHAIYGGVYGKNHGVLEGHPRTGELMPILDPLGAAAACGLECYDSDVFGPEYRNNLFLCQFNMRKVSRHILKPAGATYKTEDSDFVWSDFVDFHPTDIVVDADGSLLVIDTGGWYKLCCPTSQLWKPDVLGGIYRVRKTGAKPPADPRGKEIDWPHQTLEQLWALHADNRQAVRLRASREFVHRSDAPDMGDFLNHRHFDQVSANADGTISQVEISALARTWTVAQIETPDSRELLEEIFSFGSDRVRHAILLAISSFQDRDILYPSLVDYALKDPSPANRRALAEALGRLGERWAVPQLLAAADKADDRVLQHSVIYALIELADPGATRRGLAAKSPKTIAAALIALDQMPNGEIKPADVIPHLGVTDNTLRNAAGWVVRQHPEWGGELAQWLGQQLKSLPSEPSPKAQGANTSSLADMLALFSPDPAVQKLLADACMGHDSSAAVRLIALRVMAQATIQSPPANWIQAIAKAITNADAVQLPLAIAAARRFPAAAAADPKLSQALATISDGAKYPLEQRVDALAILVGKHPQLNDAQFELLRHSLSAETPVAIRSAAADAISNSHLNTAQLEQLYVTIQSANPLELNRLLKPFQASKDEALGLKLIATLKKSTSLSSLRMDLLREALAKYDPAVQRAIDELESLVNVDAAAQASALRSCCRSQRRVIRATVTPCFTARRPPVRPAIGSATPAALRGRNSRTSARPAPSATSSSRSYIPA